MQSGKTPIRHCLAVPGAFLIFGAPVPSFRTEDSASKSRIGALRVPGLGRQMQEH